MKFKFFYTNGTMVERHFDDAGAASEFAWAEGDHLVRWCEAREGQDYDFIKGEWIEA